MRVLGGFKISLRSSPTSSITPHERLQLASIAIGHQLVLTGSHIECRQCVLNVVVPSTDGSVTGDANKDELFHWGGCLLGLIIWHGRVAGDETLDDPTRMEFRYVYKK